MHYKKAPVLTRLSAQIGESDPGSWVAIPSRGIVAERPAPSRVRCAAKNAPLTARADSAQFSAMKEWGLYGMAPGSRGLKMVIVLRFRRVQNRGGRWQLNLGERSTRIEKLPPKETSHR
jgi:hypothetical protein